QTLLSGDPGSAPLDDAHVARAGDDRRMGEPNKQTVLDHACNAVETLGERFRIGDPLESGIQNPVPSVRDESVAVLGPPQLRVPSDVRSAITSRPARTRCARSSTKCLAVVPLPRPSRMPAPTKSRARAAAARFWASTSIAIAAVGSVSKQERRLSSAIERGSIVQRGRGTRVDPLPARGYGPERP